jgi:hypothetical protein
MHQWTEKLWLFTEEEFDKLPDGFELVCIHGGTRIKGKDKIAMDTRFGCLAYGVENPLSHPEAELLSAIVLACGK